MSKQLEANQQKQLDVLYEKAVTHINRARETVQRTVDTEMVKAYWMIGRDIVEEEQQGKERAEYRAFLIKTLSKKLKGYFGKRFSATTLKEIRTFYLEYSSTTAGGEKGHALRDLSDELVISQLSWTHYHAHAGKTKRSTSVLRKRGCPKQLVS